MLTNKERQRLVSITRETGNEVVQYLQGDKLRLERVGDSHGVQAAVWEIRGCDAAVHTHPYDDLPFSSSDLLVALFHPYLKVHEVLCFGTAYRITVPQQYELGLYDDLLIEDTLGCATCHSSHPQVIQNRMFAITDICDELGWKFEQFSYGVRAK